MPSKKRGRKTTTVEVVPACSLEDLPQPVRDAIYISDCHVTGEHDPEHTLKWMCQLQLRDMAIRILKAVGIDIYIDGSDADRVRERNKIPRKLDRNGWFNYYVKQTMAGTGRSADESRQEMKDRIAKYSAIVASYEEWERNGFKLPTATCE